MKKISVLFLMCLYLVSATGITITAHFCGGKLDNISINQINIKECCCGNKKMKKNCCKTKTCNISIKEFQNKIAEIDFHFIAFSFPPVLFKYVNTTIQPAITILDFYNQYPPPNEIKHPLYLLNQVFRI